jgi:hypothetical protein
MPVKNKKLPVTLPADTFFYLIPLEPGHFELRRSMLEAHYPIPKGRKLYYGNQVEYAGYARSLVTVNVRLNSGVTATLHLHAEPDALHVACTCGMPGEKLCLHAYIGLYNLTWSHILDLSPWYWPGYDINDKVQHRYLDIQVAKNYITAKPKHAFGHLFRPVKALNSLPVVQQPPDAPLHDPHNMLGNRAVLVFCIGYGRAPAGSGQLPVLFACRAQTTVDNLSLHTYTEITDTGGHNNLPGISANQLCLLDIAAEMRQLVYGDTGSQEAIRSVMLLLWEKALPILNDESYTCVFNPYRMVYKKGMIAALNKSFTSPCRFSVYRPVLHFVLKVQRDHLSLSAALSINGREIEFNHKPELFSVDLETGYYYLAQSVQADDHLNWMYARHNRITVLKAHFAQFHLMFLNDLAGRFPVYMIKGNTSAGKLTLYDHNVVSQQLNT